MELISRKEAIKKGLIKFFTGKKCKNGHISEQYTKSWKCVECQKEKAKKYREDNLEKLHAYDVEYSKKNKNKKAEYYQKNREKRLQQNKENREEKAIYNKNYGIKNKLKISIQKKKYHQDNIKKRIEYNKKLYLLKREEKLEYQKKYQRTEKGRAVSANTRHKRRATIENGSATTDYIIKLRKQKYCYWCGEKIHKGNLHIDHYIPLSKGGEHSNENLVASCSKCNLSKHTRNPEEFAIEKGKLF